MSDFLLDKRINTVNPFVRYAGFGIRLVARLIDLLFMVILGNVYGFFMGFFLEAAKGYGYSGGHPKILNEILGVLVVYGYMIYFPWSWWQATPGKRVMGIYIQKPDGKKLLFWNSVGRELASILSVITFFIGYFMAIWTKEKTTLHDIVANTRVVYGKK